LLAVQVLHLLAVLAVQAVQALYLLAVLAVQALYLLSQALLGIACGGNTEMPHAMLS
jgi:hypothetical protein